MGLIVTLTGDAGKYLIRGAIWESGASSYRAYVHLVPSGPRLDLMQSVVSVVSVTGPTVEKVLDAAVAQVMTTAGTPVQNLDVRAAPREPTRQLGGVRQPLFQRRLAVEPAHLPQPNK